MLTNHFQQAFVYLITKTLIQMKKFLPILIFATSVLVLNSCKKDVETKDDIPVCAYGDIFTPELPGPVTLAGLIPVSSANYWVYADTIWTSDSTYSGTGIDTVRAYNPRQTEDDIWMTIDGKWPIRNIHQADDLVYSLETELTGCKTKSLAFFEAPTDTLFNSSLAVGDMLISRIVYKTTATVNTPAGDFDHCSVFDHLYSKGYQILKPGIGFAKFASDDHNGTYSESTLIDYYIE